MSRLPGMMMSYTVPLSHPGNQENADVVWMPACGRLRSAV